MRDMATAGRVGSGNWRHSSHLRFLLLAVVQVAIVTLGVNPVVAAPATTEAALIVRRDQQTSLTGAGSQPHHGGSKPISQTVDDENEIRVPSELTDFQPDFSDQISSMAAESGLATDDIRKLHDILRGIAVEASEAELDQHAERNCQISIRQQLEGQDDRIREACYDQIDDQTHLAVFLKILAERVNEAARRRALQQNRVINYLKEQATRIGLTDSELDRFLRLFEKYLCRWNRASLANATDLERDAQFAMVWQHTKNELQADFSEEDKKHFQEFLAVLDGADHGVPSDKRNSSHADQCQDGELTIPRSWPDFPVRLSMNWINRIHHLAQSSGLDLDDVNTLVGIFQANAPWSRRKVCFLWTDEAWNSYFREVNARMQSIKREALHRIRDGVRVQEFFARLNHLPDFAQTNVRQTVYAYLRCKAQDYNVGHRTTEKLIELLRGVHWAPGVSFEADEAFCYERLERKWLDAKADLLAGDEVADDDDDAARARLNAFLDSVTVELLNRKCQCIVDHTMEWDILRLANASGLDASEISELLVVFEKHSGAGIVWSSNPTQSDKQRIRDLLFGNWKTAGEEYLHNRPDKDKVKLSEVIRAIENDYQQQMDHGPLCVILGWPDCHDAGSFHHGEAEGHSASALQPNNDVEIPNNGSKNYNDICTSKADGSESLLLSTGQRDGLRELFANLASEVGKIAREVGLMPADISKLLEVFGASRDRIGTKDRRNWTIAEWEVEKTATEKFIETVAFERLQMHPDRVRAFFEKFARRIEQIRENMRRATRSHVRSFARAVGFEDETEVDGFLDFFEQFRELAILWGPAMSRVELEWNRHQLDVNWSQAKREFLAQLQDDLKKRRFEKLFTAIEDDFEIRKFRALCTPYIERFARVNDVSAAETTSFLELFYSRFENTLAYGNEESANVTSEQLAKTLTAVENGWRLAKTDFLQGMNKSDVGISSVKRFFDSFEADYKQRKTRRCNCLQCLLYDEVIPQSSKEIADQVFPYQESSKNHELQVEISSTDQAQENLSGSFDASSFNSEEEESLLRPTGQRNEYREFYGNFTAQLRKLGVEVGLRQTDIRKLVAIFEQSRAEFRATNHTDWTDEQWEHSKKIAEAQIRRVAFDAIRDPVRLWNFFLLLAERKEQVKAIMRRKEAVYLRSFAEASGLDERDIDMYLAVFEQNRREGVHWRGGMNVVDRAKNRRQLERNWTRTKREFLAQQTNNGTRTKFESFFKAVEDNFELRKFRRVAVPYLRQFAQMEKLAAADESSLLEVFDRNLRDKSIVWRRSDMTDEDLARTLVIVEGSWQRTKSELLKERLDDDKLRLSRFFTAIETNYRRRKASGLLCARCFEVSKDQLDHSRVFEGASNDNSRNQDESTKTA